MKGLILCAGKGTRLQPFTYTKPKCLIPVYGEPIVISIISKFARLGIREIGIVMSPTQKLIPETLGNGEAYGVSLTYIMQEEPLGLAYAVKAAHSFINEAPFFLMLGDNLIEGALEPLIALPDNRDIAASILLTEVEDPQQYGIAHISNNTIVGLQEKPLEPKSNLAIVGAYAFYSSDIWKAIDQLKPSKRGEYELTDAIMMLINVGKQVTYSITTEPFFDIGNTDRWLAVNRYKLDAGHEHMPSTHEQSLREANVTLIPPVNIHPSAKLVRSVIGPYVYIGPNCFLTDCRIENSILIDHVHLSNLNAHGSIFGSKVEISSSINSNKPSKFIIGDSSSIN
ncbi:hypothetical protein E0485_00510 [Paenibacillus albiflavus]|uniref:Nucleotidyl transferase domain-containing protein n=1 Tax=Paenibacillus albiflavus TaxID=2545760 RepID=A0A4R4EQE4_9BACL|nr:sugar phosphate nucleotidyltransferase [Paenibacillus albiflavus]TCZ80811.1 hypothetical protein E0485_00510 [Paenibacillus albiflavus]